MLTSRQLRQKFLDFFESKGHTVLPSSSLVPKEDPTVLFNTAGMQPIVPFLLGEPHPGGTRLVNSQKCIRTDDIDEVGDNRHATFFEMLGFWSLGDYFKEETIEWMFEFLTAKEWLNLDPKRLFVTVYKGNSQKVENLINLISQKVENSSENSSENTLENEAKTHNLEENLENLDNLESKTKIKFINQVDSDEEAVIFWQKQFEKVGIYADVGDEFDFRKAKAETAKSQLEMEHLQTLKLITKNNSERKKPRIWQLNFLDSKILGQILTHQKTIETRALNPEESDRYFGDILPLDILELVDKSESGKLQSYFWKIEKIAKFDNLEAAFLVLDFNKVLPEIISQTGSQNADKSLEKSQVLEIKNLENLENVELKSQKQESLENNSKSEVENIWKMAEKSNSTSNLTPNSETENNSKIQNAQNSQSENSQDNSKQNGSKESLSLGEQIGKIINIFKKEENSDLNKLQDLQKLGKPTLTEIQQLYVEKFGEEYLQKIEKNGLITLFLGEQISKIEVENYLKNQELNSQNSAQNSGNWESKNPENLENYLEIETINPQSEKSLENIPKSAQPQNGMNSFDIDNSSEKEETEHQLLILSGPSGSGKSTVTRHLLEERSDFALSVSCTTRSPRMNEENGKDYYFLTREEFETKIKNGEFAEWQEVYLGAFYGTLKTEIERIWTIGKIPIFDIDYAGGLNLKKLYPKAIDIFLEAPNLSVLEERLRLRGTETEEKIATRIAKAKIELEHKNQFSNVVINREWEETVGIINQILLENNKTEKKIAEIPQILFASNNQEKIEMFQKSVAEQNVKVVTLQNLDYEILEPLENGADNVQNAQIKAEYYWQNLRVKMPVIAENKAVDSNLVEIDDKSEIKKIMESALEDNLENNKKLQELITKYGKIQVVENIALCLFDGQNICNETVVLENWLTNEENSQEIVTDSPLASFCKIKINSTEKFLSELNLEEKSNYLQDLTNKYQKLITEMESLDKIRVIFIHGGNSFESYEEYLENLSQTPAKWNQKTTKWKDSLDEFLGDNYKVCGLSMPNSQNANYKEWQIQFDKIRDSLDYKTVLVGHSLGGIFLAKYLSENPLSQKISQLHLIAAPFERVGSFSLDQNLSQSSTNLEQIQKNCQQIYLYHSSDDLVVNFEELAKYQAQLPLAQSLIFSTRGHFLQPEFPELVEQIKKNKRLDKITTLSKIEKTQNSDLELEKPPKYIYRITKKSGKDNWWGLPYRGPCGPCSEVYYLLDKNDLTFEQTQFPQMNLDEIEEFLESQIVEIGNNVFMMYEGEKDAQKEPINLVPLTKQNIDTGLGFERFLAVINGMESIHETDCLKPIADVARRWARVGKD